MNIRFGKTLTYIATGALVVNTSAPVIAVPVVPNFQQGSMTSHTETTSKVTETINSMDYNTGYQFSVTGSGVTADGNLSPTPSTTNVTIGDTDKITVEAWFKVNQLPTGSEPDFIITRQDDWQVFVVNEGGQLKVRGRIRKDWSGVWPAVTSNAISPNTWYHVAFVRNGNDWALYLNGTAENTRTVSGSITSSSNGALDIGRRFNGAYFVDGYMDDLRITKGLARYTSNFTPPTSAHLTSAGDVNKQIIVNSSADGVDIGTGGINQARIAKAWVNFNGTGTVAIRSSYNVSSITDNGTGIYTVNFSSNMTDTNYAVSGSVGSTSASAGWVSNGNNQDSHTVNNTTSSCRVSCAYQSVSGHFDALVLSVNVFGN